MRNYFKILLSNSNKASSRRFIALLTLPFYIGGIVTGIILSFITKDFRFYLASIIAAGLPIYLAFFSLTWEHIKDILNTNAFKKRSDGLYEIDQDQLKDP